MKFSILPLLVSVVCLSTVWFNTDYLNTGAAGSERPNIILCMADDQGWEEVGYNGHPDLKTPVLDEMARTGLRFDRFYSASSNCGPTRGSVMTGRHAFRFGQFGPTWAMRPEEITLAEILNEHGYATAHYGKWHLGPVKADAPNNPGNQGFDEWVSHDNFFELDPPLSKNGAPPEIVPGESSEVIVTEAIKFIRRAIEADTPFFTVIWFGSCHGPHLALERDRTLYEHLGNEGLANRYGEITAMDRAVGQLRNALRKLQIEQNTLLWYCSDNGISHRWRNQPELNGAKGNLFEGGVRVPAVIEWPLGFPKPLRTDAACVTSDILPTVCDILEIPLPNRVFDGISLVPILKGRAKKRGKPICFWHYDQLAEYKNQPWMDAESQRGTTPTHSNPATQFRNFKHPVAKTKDFGGDAAILSGRYKLIVDLSGRHRNTQRTNPPVTEDISLFDLASDPGEATNIAQDQPDLVSKLTNQLNEWQASVEQSMTGREYQ